MAPTDEAVNLTSEKHDPCARKVTYTKEENKPPRSTALERQVQTLAAAVERLTKQNHDLEEQLRQRDAGHNIQEEN